MNGKNTPPSLAELLQHAAWTRHLARGLVGEAAADDVVQETWIAALHRPPDESQPLRPWLVTVVRNKVFNRSRDQARRASREARAEVREAPESAEDLLGRLETHKLLVEVVSELPEPYRQMILLAYFDELTSAEIGERHNLPASTVRGRLKTALQLLREALDRRVGSRATWLRAVNGLARPQSRLVRARDARPRTETAPAGARRVSPVGGAPFLPGVAWVGAITAVVAIVATLWSIARKPPTSMTQATSGSGFTDIGARASAASRRGPLAASGLGPPGGTFLTAIRGWVVAGDDVAASTLDRVARDGGGVSGAVVRLVGAPPAQVRPPPATAPLRIVYGRFASGAQIIPAGAPLALRNDDDRQHLVRVARGTVELFRGAIPGHQLATIMVPRGQDVLRVELLDAKRGEHTFVAPDENGYAAVTDHEGGFVLWAIPPGHYTIEVWDETLGTQTAEVTVPLAKPLLRFVFGSDPAVR